MTMSYRMPRSPYPPLPSGPTGPTQAVDDVVLPPPTGLVARDLLAALLAGLYAWQHAALDLTLTFDRYVHGSWQPYAAVGHLWGLSIGLIPCDDRGTAWALDIACPHSDLSRRAVRLVHLRAVLAGAMLALYARTPAAHWVDEVAEDGALPPWHAPAQAALRGAGLSLPGSPLSCDPRGDLAPTTPPVTGVRMHRFMVAATRQALAAATCPGGQRGDRCTATRPAGRSDAVWPRHAHGSAHRTRMRRCR